MSASPVPTYVDTRKVFLQLGSIAGFVALERLARFRDCLASETGTVYVELGFGTSETGIRLITGKLKADVTVTCQRCLEPLGIALRDDIRLALLQDETGVADLDKDLDPWICAETKLQLAELIEEQLMLCLPIVSTHDTADCSSRLEHAAGETATDRSNKNGTANPFSVLKSLKNSDGTN